jgi:hypothetical protein
MKTPKLTRKIIRDDLALSDAISAVLLASKKWNQHRKAVLKIQRRLHRLVSHGAWMVFLRLDGVMNERTSFEQDVLVRWAFRQGRRYDHRHWP